MPRCTVIHDSLVGAYEITFISRSTQEWTKIKSIIDMIKVTIPASDREYNPRTKTWTITDKYWITLEALLKGSSFTIALSQKKLPEQTPKEYEENFFYSSTESGANSASQSNETATSIAQKLGEFLGVPITTQDLNDLKKLYRQKARQYHPDINPAPDAAQKMSELNRLWTLYANFDSGGEKVQ